MRRARAAARWMMCWSAGRGKSSAHARASGHPVLSLFWLWVPAFAGTSGLEARQNALAFLLRNEEKVGDVFARGHQRLILVAACVELRHRLEAASRKEDAVGLRRIAPGNPRDDSRIERLDQLDHQHRTLRGDHRRGAVEHGLLMTLHVNLDERAIRNRNIVEPPRLDVEGDAILLRGIL